MTTIKDSIRQASLFTMNGLVDPRFMPGYSESKTETKKVKKKSTFITSISFRGIVENFLKRKLEF